MNEVTVRSLFAGIGGFCRGFIVEGARVLWANESDKYTCQVYRQNFSHRLLEKDVRDLHMRGSAGQWIVARDGTARS